MRAINPYKLSKMQYLAFKNCLRLHYDAVNIFKNKSYDTAVFLSVLSQEELGKVIILDDIVWNVGINNWDRKMADSLLQKIFNHKYKQVIFAKNFEYKDFKEMLKRMKYMDTGKLEKIKQNAVYVGLEKRKITGRIIKPKTSKTMAKEQISIMNTALLDLTSRKIAQGGLFDGYYVDNLINRKLLRKLEYVRSALS